VFSPREGEKQNNRQSYGGVRILSPPHGILVGGELERGSAFRVGLYSRRSPVVFSPREGEKQSNRQSYGGFESSPPLTESWRGES
jgi:hypothetical protein